MNGGDTDTGGAQVNPNAIPTNTSSAQSMNSIDSDAGDVSMLSIPHNQSSANTASQPPQQSVAQPGGVASIVGQTSGASPVSSTVATTGQFPNATSVTASAPNQPLNYTSRLTPNLVSQSQSEDQLFSQTSAPSNPPTQPNLNTPSYQYKQQSIVQSTTQPTLSNSEDIILSKPSHMEPKKSKIFVIVAIVIGIGILATCIYFVIANINQFNNDSIHNNMHTSLNRYVNYLLYESDSDSSINGDIDWFTNKIEEKLATDDDTEKKDYIDKLNTLYEDFMTAFSEDTSFMSSDDYDYEFYNNLVNGVKDSLSVLGQYISTKNLSTDEMVKMYFQMGGDELLDYVKTYYIEFTESSSGMLRRYGLFKSDIATTIRELIIQSNDSDCAIVGPLDESCINLLSSLEEVLRLKSQLRDKEDELHTLKQRIEENVIDHSKVLYEEINVKEDDE